MHFYLSCMTFYRGGNIRKVIDWLVVVTINREP